MEGFVFLARCPLLMKSHGVDTSCYLHSIHIDFPEKPVDYQMFGPPSALVWLQQVPACFWHSEGAQQHPAPRQVMGVT